LYCKLYTISDTLQSSDQVKAWTIVSIVKLKSLLKVVAKRP